MGEAGEVGVVGAVGVVGVVGVVGEAGGASKSRVLGKVKACWRARKEDSMAVTASRPEVGVGAGEAGLETDVGAALGARASGASFTCEHNGDVRSPIGYSELGRASHTFDDEGSPAAGAARGSSPKRLAMRLLTVSSISSSADPCPRRSSRRDLSDGSGPGPREGSRALPLPFAPCLGWGAGWGAGAVGG